MVLRRFYRASNESRHKNRKNLSLESQSPGVPARDERSTEGARPPSLELPEHGILPDETANFALLTCR